MIARRIGAFVDQSGGSEPDVAIFESSHPPLSFEADKPEEGAESDRADGSDDQGRAPRSADGHSPHLLTGRPPGRPFLSLRDIRAVDRSAPQWHLIAGNPEDFLHVLEATGSLGPAPRHQPNPGNRHFSKCGLFSGQWRSRRAPAENTDRDQGPGHGAGDDPRGGVKLLSRHVPPGHVFAFNSGEGWSFGLSHPFSP